MSRKKWLPLALLGACALLLGLALELLSGGEAEPESIALCELDPEQVDSVAYTWDGADVELHRQADGSWQLQQDMLLPLDKAEIDSMVQDMTALEAQRDLGAQEDTADMGFAAPQGTIRLAAGQDSCLLTVGALNSVTGTYYLKNALSDHIYTVGSASISGLCRSVQALYAAQGVTDMAAEDLTSMTVRSAEQTLEFLQNDGVWTLADDPGFLLDQEQVQRMANTVCGLQTTWSITAPQSAAAYGLDAPDVVVTVTGEGGSTTCRFGALLPDEDGQADQLCYLQVDGVADVVYETLAEHKAAFACTRQTLAAQTESAGTDEDAEDAADVAAPEVSASDSSTQAQ